MEFKQIRTFVALAEHMHFGRTAEHLNIAQPHVSRRIKQLEEELNVLLFYRDRRNVKLTAAGEVFLVEAKRLLRDGDTAKERARESALGRRGNLHVSMLGTAVLGTLPAILGEFHQRHPNVHLTFKEMLTAAILEELSHGTTDVAFFHPPIRAVGPYEQITVEREPLIAVLPKKHRLARQSKIRLFDLANDPWVMFPRENGAFVYDLIISLCQKAGFSPRIIEEADAVQTRLGLIASGFGVHLVHRTWETMPYPGVAYVVVEPTATIGLSCYWRKDNANPILRTFIDVVGKYEVARTAASAKRQIARAKTASST
jgi:DNA-binding transcriptional LysR family regulator